MNEETQRKTIVGCMVTLALAIVLAFKLALLGGLVYIIIQLIKCFW